MLFKNRSARNQFYFTRFKLEGKTIENIGLAKPEGNKGLIWINEYLTGKRKRLLAKTKDDISKAGFHVGKDGIGIFAERAEQSEAAEPICHLSAWCKMYMKFHLHTKRILKSAVLATSPSQTFLTLTFT